MFKNYVKLSYAKPVGMLDARSLETNQKHVAVYFAKGNLRKLQYKATKNGFTLIDRKVGNVSR